MAATPWMPSKPPLPFSKTIPSSTAGFGSHLNQDGQVECDAIVMEAATLNAGSVAGLRQIKNPIRLARRVLENCPHMMLISDGAERFAVQQKLPLCAPADLVSPADAKPGPSAASPPTIRAITNSTTKAPSALSPSTGKAACFAATSTGGVCCKLPGRVGDSPLIGCGCYADSETGGASSTGYGEAIMRIVMAKAATDSLRAPDTSAMTAAQNAIHLLAARGKGTGGIILLDKLGNPGYAFIRRVWRTDMSLPIFSFITAT